MLKKSILLLVLLFSIGFSNVSFAEGTGTIDKYNGITQSEYLKTQTIIYNKKMEDDKKINDLARNLNEKRFEQEAILEDMNEKKSTLEEKAIATKRLDDLSDKNIANNKAKKEKIKADVDVRSKESEIERKNDEIKKLEIENDKAKKYLNDTPGNKTFITESVKANSDLLKAKKDKEKLETELITNKKSASTASDNLDKSKKALYNTNKDVVAANKAVIEEQDTKIKNAEDRLKTAQASGDKEAEKKALSDISAANKTKEKYADKNLEEAKENFANSPKGIVGLKKVDAAKAIIAAAETPQAKKMGEELLAIAKKELSTNEELAITTAQESVDNAKKASKDARNAFCKESKGCIEKTSFIINVNDISPGLKVKKDSTINENINFVLGTIIQKLMIALGSFALLIMTVGAGYIVLHNGQDELLNKGKAIFMSGVYSLVVALGSYYIIAIVRYILYF